MSSQRDPFNPRTYSNLLTVSVTLNSRDEPQVQVQAQAARDVAPPPDLFDKILVRIAHERAPARPAAPVLALRGASQRRMRLVVSAGALAACLVLAIAAWFLYAHPGKPKSEVNVAAMDCGGLYKNFWGRLERMNF